MKYCTLYSVILLVIFASCSTDQTLPSAGESYSHTTQKEFELIEKSGVYKSPVSETRESNSRSKKHPKSSNVKSVEAPLDVPKDGPPELQASSQLSAKNQERLQEINQNLAFFCMKHRKDPAFGSEEKCLTFTKKVLANCEKKHKIINTVMVNCIKDHLKKRSAQ